MAKKMKLGELLKKAGLVTEEQIVAAIREQQPGQKLGDLLLEKGYITEQQLIEVLEFQLGIPHVSLFRYPFQFELVKLVPIQFARKHIIIPLSRENNILTVAMHDPMDYYAIDDMEMYTGFSIKPVIAAKADILEAITAVYKEAETGEARNDVAAEAAPAIRIVEQLIAAGVQLKASDIHMDPYENEVQVRYRIDGDLRRERTLPKSIQAAVVARVKILANMNITETRLPQDGRIKLKMENTHVDLRISVLPTVFGEKVVIRILDLSNVIKGLDELDFSEDNFKKYSHLIEQPSGLILFTGPTGSGKSSGLYASINHLNREQYNIITVEDPVEFELQGVNQMQINSNIGLTFATGLRSILRQDPNIIMVGEIRDSETAEIAVRASLTGHLVFSTLHTNNAIASIPRLMDMKIEPYLVVSSVSGVVSQRLVKRICRDCKEAYSPSSVEAELLGRHSLDNEILYRGRGCNSCKQTGYKGRMAVHELLVVDDQIRDLLIKNRSVDEIKQAAIENGMKMLIDDGLEKALQGMTTVEEVLRITVDS
ncbi:GspE/PulE family protein [Terribacillus saccharophilus]|uniref:Type II secretion system protein GspE n=1 Tax=Terribacillus saccharophilus TaxID=361277 RepID=A0ABX4H130_9BACI|nr:ATPase, T2SS/T4P/T4SS family [Terribacillus saccharophilus]PAD36430.1 type II secretion system protein GspE [Terribacillus saccharophilus]PAD97094.1 type II secretion system protein GspE [Terribacillus saccharophilus]PAE00842.1 type II secretion system protein GspE [Terribacillus saccharophilus]